MSQPSEKRDTDCNQSTTAQLIRRELADIREKIHGLERRKRLLTGLMIRIDPVLRDE